MKIAISGHTAGIGKSFATYFAARGHDIIGVSRRQGMNIRSIPKVYGHIKDCDMFINNAQEGFAQTELLHKLWTTWHDQPKMIWLISTCMTTQSQHHSEYKTQKQALETAYYNLKDTGTCQLILIRPGKVNTQSEGGADVDAWVDMVCNTWIDAQRKQLLVEEISLGYTEHPVLEL